MSSRGRRLYVLAACVVAALAAAWAASSLSPRFDLLENLQCAVCNIPRVSGKIAGCGCDAESVDELNSRHFLPTLHRLTRTVYFRYFQVDLWRPCPFWKADGQCQREDCAVCECDPDEIPLCWREEDELARAKAARKGGKGGKGSASSGSGGSGSPTSSSGKVGWGGYSVPAAPLDYPPDAASEGFHPHLAAVTVAEDEQRGSGGGGLTTLVWGGAGVEGMDALDGGSGGSGTGGAGGGGGGMHWGASDPTLLSSSPAPVEAEEGEVWTEPEDPTSPDYQYVNLLDNPEGYTGYQGQAIWKAIYSENCFNAAPSSSPSAGEGEEDEGQCLEEGVFYRLISGLQASINTHIAMTYGDGKGSPNKEILASRKAGGKGGKGGSSKGLSGSNTTSTPVWRLALPWLGEVTATPSSSASSFSLPSVTWVPPEWWWWVRGVLSGRPEAAHEWQSSAAAAAASASSGPDALVLTPGLKPSLPLYLERVGRHPDRLHNLYFAYLVVLRGLARMTESLDTQAHLSPFRVGSGSGGGSRSSGGASVAASYLLSRYSGEAEEDALTQSLFSQLLHAQVPAVLAGFDESALFKGGSEGDDDDDGGGALADLVHRADDDRTTANSTATGAFSSRPSGAALRDTFREKYRNISRVMDCVGCEKCRLWGKLQFLGLGTALKALFAERRYPVPWTRNEWVAVVNVLHRLSISLHAVSVMRAWEAQVELHKALVSGGQKVGGGLGVAAVAWVAMKAVQALARWWGRRRAAEAKRQ